MDLPVAQVVDLHQVEALKLPFLKRILHLPDAVLLAIGPDLGRGEQLVLRPAALQQLTDHLFRRAVHRRGVDQLPAVGEKGLHHLDETLERGLVTADVKGSRAAEPDHRYRFPGVGDGFADQGFLRSAQCAGRQPGRA